MRRAWVAWWIVVGFGCGGSPPTTGEQAGGAVVAASGPATASAAELGHSRVLDGRFASTALGVEKRYRVYLPAGYDAEPARRWPTFYYLHGMTGSEDDWLDHGGLAGAADALGLGAIVVMPDGDNGFYADAVEPAPPLKDCLADGVGLLMPGAPRASSCVAHRAYERYLIDDLIGHVDATYRTIAVREGRAIAGLSMGGFGALGLAMRHPDRFAAVASHSGVAALLYAGPHPFVAGQAQIADDVGQWGQEIGRLGGWIRGIFGPELANWRAHDPATLVDQLVPGQLAIYLDCGVDDGFALDDGASYLSERLTARGIEHTLWLGPGAHDFGLWKARLPESLRFLADHVGAAHHAGAGG